jgi:hypothetical protein
MPRKNRFLSSFLSVILIFSITLTNVHVALRMMVQRLNLP